MFDNVLGESILRIAQKKKKLVIRVHDLRSWTPDRHRTADDKPYGGGAGMVMMVGPIHKALVSLVGKKTVLEIMRGKKIKKKLKIILLSPKGSCFSQGIAKELSKIKHVIFICGHYEGVDERVRSLVTDEISIGDYILTGGELPAMVVLDALGRLIPGVLGDRASLDEESFENNLLEYPHYTRPREFNGLKVPEVLLRGDHKKIAKWRKDEALKRTRELRDDLLSLH